MRRCVGPNPSSIWPSSRLLTSRRERSVRVTSVLGDLGAYRKPTDGMFVSTLIHGAHEDPALPPGTGPSLHQSPPLRVNRLMRFASVDAWTRPSTVETVACSDIDTSRTGGSRGNAKRNVRGGGCGNGWRRVGRAPRRRPSRTVRRRRVEFQFREPAGQFAVAGTFDSNEPTSPHSPARQLFEIHSDLRKYPRVEMTFAAPKPMFFMSPTPRTTNPWLPFPQVGATPAEPPCWTSGHTPPQR